MGISWGYHGVIMGISWGYHGDIMGISWGYHGDIMGISWGYHEDIIGISLGYQGGIMGMSWGYGMVAWVFWSSQMFSLWELSLNCGTGLVQQSLLCLCQPIRNKYFAIYNTSF
jgi:hypothetical protein